MHGTSGDRGGAKGGGKDVNDEWTTGGRTRGKDAELRKTGETHVETDGAACAKSGTRDRHEDEVPVQRRGKSRSDEHGTQNETRAKL
ncbi:hypothetical protein ERJ75_001833700 [Trypanosoma vivax]|nr:hypothetical protein ERJ75_001833700 [Trypanosoma vivax]